MPIISVEIMKTIGERERCDRCVGAKVCCNEMK